MTPPEKTFKAKLLSSTLKMRPDKSLLEGLSEQGFGSYDEREDDWRWDKAELKRLGEQALYRLYLKVKYTVSEESL